MHSVSSLERARAALERGERVPEATLRPPIAESWRRCVDLGLDPARSPADIVAPFADVARKRLDMGALRSLAFAEMQALHAQISGSNFMIAFADSDGLILDTLCDQVFADSPAGRKIIPGSIWSEGACGTNALGLAAASASPAAVYGREHFFATHGALSCVAAPILNPCGELVGLIDASCANDARQQHTHALVRMAAIQVENSLIFHERRESFILAFHPRCEFLDTLSAGLLATSADGEILSVNRAGAALLAGLAAKSGAEFSELFDGRFCESLSLMLNGAVIRVRDRAGSHVFMACRQIGRTRKRPASSAWASQPSDQPLADFVCDDPRVAAALNELGPALAMRMPVHIFGETGVGKELMARHVHDASRRVGEFVAVNCGALPESLFVAELFGYEGGAFTNARASGARGLVRQADGGTLFLDEVSDIPFAAQSALLRFLDDGDARAVGGRTGGRLDVQIVSATNRSLDELVASRQFRADLLHRLNAFTIALPPLRARTDFAEIARRLVAQLEPQVTITDAAIEKLALLQWPGNIRELRHMLQRALIRCRTGRIEADAFDSGSSGEAANACPACRASPLDRRFCEEIDVVHRAKAGNIAATARQLGLSRTTVYKHLRR